MHRILLKKSPVLDFDGNVANTLATAEVGTSVEAACNATLECMFEESNLLSIVGGLQSRAPTELIRDLIALRPDLRSKGRHSYRRRRHELTTVMPRGFGIRLVEITPQNEVDMLGEYFVRVKLYEHLLPYIGDQWPQPFPGVLDFFEMIRRKDRAIVVVSSGHDLFIRRTFERWGIAAPDLMLTDDDVRALALPFEQRMKPSPVLLDLLAMKGYSKGLFVRRPNIVYLGDSEEKDGGLARNASVPFGWFNPSDRPWSRPPGREDFKFMDWRELTGALCA